MKYVKNNEHLELFKKMFGSGLLNVYTYDIYCPFFSNGSNWIFVEGTLYLEFEDGRILEMYCTSDGQISMDLSCEERFKEMIKNV